MHLRRSVRRGESSSRSTVSVDLPKRLAGSGRETAQRPVALRPDQRLLGAHHVARVMMRRVPPGSPTVTTTTRAHAAPTSSSTAPPPCISEMHREPVRPRSLDPVDEEIDGHVRYTRLAKHSGDGRSSLAAPEHEDEGELAEPCGRDAGLKGEGTRAPARRIFLRNFSAPCVDLLQQAGFCPVAAVRPRCARQSCEVCVTPDLRRWGHPAG